MKENVQGLDRFRQDLSQLPKEARREISSEMRGIAKSLRADIVMGAAERTGATKRSIRIRTSKGGLKVEVGQIYDVEYSKLAFWARFNEKGTRGYAKGSKTLSGKTARRNIPARPARPFIQPAADAAFSWAPQRIDRVLTRLMASS